MAQSEQTKVSVMDKVKWLAVVVVVAAAVYGNIRFSGSYSVAVRAVGVIVLGLVALLLAVTTAHGQRVWNFSKAARLEMRKVVWPTRQETMQTTMIVVVIVAIVGLLMLLFDNIFQYVINSIIL